MVVPEKTEQAQLNVAYCGICGSDLHILQGSEDKRMTLPSVIGHECSGVVGEVGEGVDGVKPGDRVVVWPVKSCGECPACKEGFGHVCQHLQVRGIETEGAFQSSWTLDADALVKIPEGSACCTRRWRSRLLSAAMWSGAARSKRAITRLSSAAARSG